MASVFFGSIIGLRPEYAERYVALHANTFPGVLKRISRSNIRNYSIFLHGGVLFSHQEYVGRNHAEDMAAIGTDETTRQWWKLTDPMQVPLPERTGTDWWAALDVVSEHETPAPNGPVHRVAFVCPRPAMVTTGALRLAGAHKVRVFQGRERFHVYAETKQPPDARALAADLQHLLHLDATPHVMEEVFHTDGLEAAARKVFVSGCYDMLHSGHVAFLKEAATYGELHVGIGSDATVVALKGRHAVNSQDERRYMIEALSCVTRCTINSGSGIIDFDDDIRALRPDMLVVNEDGHTAAKEALCKTLGIEYRVLKRIPHGDLPARSTTALRQECTMPFRIDVAGGWLDQPFVSRFHPGTVVTVSLEPTHDFNERSGMASSTRRKAIELWRHRLPHGDPQALAKVLFSYENPPGTKEVAGSQDALGIVMPGLNRHFYDGGYWPTRTESHADEGALEWLEEHLHLVTLGPRVGSYSVLDDTRIDAAGARALAEAADDCWNAIIRRDAPAFGQAFRRSFEAQVAMFPRMVDPGILDVIERHRSAALGWKLSGAGGGGYLILVSAKPVPGALRIKIRRSAES